MASEYDIIIVGGGPSGLSAAASIVRQDNKTVLFDSGKYRNAASEHMHTLPSWDHRNPRDFLAAARADLQRYGSVDIQQAEVETIKKRDDGLFEAVAAGKTYVGKKVILATGVEDIFPDIPGYAECWVKAIFHCLYCHGWEEKGAESAGMLAQGDVNNPVVALHFARQALAMVKTVTLYTNGNEQLAKDLRETIAASDAQAGTPAPMSVDERKIVKFEKGPEAAQIIIYFEDGTTKTEGFLAHKPSTKLRGNLAQQLELPLTPMNTIVVSPPFNQTSVKGVFAAGDCATPMQTVTAALHSGTCAGGGTPLQIQAEKYKQKAIF